MASRFDPLNKGLNGKAGKKGDEVSDIRKAPRETRSPRGPAESSASTNEVVVLNVSTELLERLEKSLAALPDVDSQRVAEIKAAIQNGDYQIDADAIADAMIRLDQSFAE